MNDLILTRLKDLKLSGVIKTLDVRSEEAIKSNMSYMEFIELLISDEILNRQTNGGNKRLQKARFPQLLTYLY